MDYTYAYQVTWIVSSSFLVVFDLRMSDMRSARVLHAAHVLPHNSFSLSSGLSLRLISAILMHFQISTLESIVRKDKAKIVSPTT